MHRRLFTLMASAARRRRFVLDSATQRGVNIIAATGRSEWKTLRAVQRACVGFAASATLRASALAGPIPL